MDISFIIESVILVIVIIQLIVLFSKNRQGSQDHVLRKLVEYDKRLDKNEIGLRNELEVKFGQNRSDLTLSLQTVSDSLAGSLKTNRDELSNSFKLFREELSTKIETLTSETKNGIEKNRETVEKKLTDIQKQNDDKLEQMRKTVDEKLHDTLEKRLTESFKQVNESFDKVQKGLVEMQSLANGVGDLKKALTNVRTKGSLGEYQLAAILEQVLTPSQYAESIKTKEGSKEFVEFAIKIPSKDDSNKSIWLPIDSKFPTVDYEALLAADETGDVQGMVQAKKDLEAKIKKFAKDIREKYIDPPNTTEFAIMFLPFEGLYAEVLRIPGLFESIHTEQKVTITGPTTISAFLNSLQMGFRSLAVEKRTSEIWDLLGAVKTQFGKFADVIEATKKKLDSASEELAKTGTRSRQIEKKLKNVQELPEPETQKLLGNLDFEDDDI
jgi:DNA recombination protein RmuC